MVTICTLPNFKGTKAEKIKTMVLTLWLDGIIIAFATQI